MKVFISWSGPRSQHIAAALYDWLPLVLQNVEPWLSQHDIEAGARWVNEIDDTLAAVDYGILVMTPGHVHAPWLLFEAGALSKHVDAARVVPYCYEMKPAEIPQGPLVKFNGVVADRPGTKKLLLGIARSLERKGERAPTEMAVDRLLESLWAQLAAAIDKTPAESKPVPPAPDIFVMVQEILDVVRGLQRGSSMRTNYDELFEALMQDGSLTDRVELRGRKVAYYPRPIGHGHAIHRLIVDAIAGDPTLSQLQLVVSNLRSTAPDQFQVEFLEARSKRTGGFLINASPARIAKEPDGIRAEVRGTLYELMKNMGLDSEG